MSTGMVHKPEYVPIYLIFFGIVAIGAGANDGGIGTIFLGIGLIILGIVIGIFFSSQKDNRIYANAKLQNMPIESNFRTPPKWMTDFHLDREFQRTGTISMKSVINRMGWPNSPTSWEILKFVKNNEPIIIFKYDDHLQIAFINKPLSDAEWVQNVLRLELHKYELTYNDYNYYTDESEVIEKFEERTKQIKKLINEFPENLKKQEPVTTTYTKPENEEHVGPKGGTYHYSKSGKKVYDKRK